MVLVTTHGSRRDPRAAHGAGAPGHRLTERCPGNLGQHGTLPDSS